MPWCQSTETKSRRWGLSEEMKIFIDNIHYIHSIKWESNLQPSRHSHVFVPWVTTASKLFYNFVNSMWLQGPLLVQAISFKFCPEAASPPTLYVNIRTGIWGQFHVRNTAFTPPEPPPAPTTAIAWLHWQPSPVRLYC